MAEIKTSYLIAIFIIIIIIVGIAAYYAGQSTAPTKTVTVPQSTTPTGTTPTTIPQKEQLIIFHWWTAGGEKQAIEKLFELYKQKYPSIEIVANPIPGGGGVNLKAVLMSRLAAGIPPDTFQSLSGAELKTYVDAGYLQSVDDIWKSTGLEDHVPPLLKKVSYFYGHYYGVPISVHRANWLWYNKKIFDQLGLKPPTTVPELLEVCKTIKEKMPNVYPIALGMREKWEIVFILDGLLLYYGGPEYYQKFYTGQLDLSNANDVEPLKKALETLKEMIDNGYIYPYSASLTWDQSVGLVAQGKAAMVFMGDFALGYFLANGYKPGVDFDGVPFPQKPTEVFLMIVDEFTLPKGAPHEDAAKKWLELLADPQAEFEFTKIKGSIAPRLDAPTNYPDKYRQENVKFYKEHPELVIPMSAHGVLAPLAFLRDYYDVMAQFVTNPNVDQTITELENTFAKDMVKEQSKWYWSS